MTGNTADISTIKINGWYDWIKFYDPVGNSLPEDKYYLWHYLGPAIDICPALKEKVLKMNGEVVQRSTHQSITTQEKDLQSDLDKKFEEKLGPRAMVKYFDDMNMEEISTFEMYGNNDGAKGTSDKPPEELEPTSDL